MNEISATKAGGHFVLPDMQDKVRVPRVSTPLVGRAHERAAITELVTDPSVRLLTLTGPGGVGKTRLAIQCAIEMASHFPHGVAFISLGALRTLEQVALAVAESLDLPVSGNTAMDVSLWQSLERQRLLLVFDNVEHLPDCGPGFAECLAACPGVTMLATSRSPLSISDEREYEVKPLPLPEDKLEWNEVGQADAVALFVQRARAVRPDFSLSESNALQVAEICRQLDGLPLAIELAAVRIKVLNPAALLSRLANSLDLLADGPRDAPNRLRTMHAATAWSYDLLTDEDRVFFRRLGVFRGSFSIAAAEAVALDPAESSDSLALDRIESLVDKSLLRQEDGADDEPRFVMLQTIREFASARLIESGEEAEIRDRLASWCLALLDEAEPHLHKAEQMEWLGRLMTEQSNLREALTWTRETSPHERFPRLASGLWSLWFNVTSLREGSQWLGEALAGANGIEPEIRVQLLTGAGLLAMARCDFDTARGRFDEALATARTLPDPHLLGLIEFGQGVVEQDEGKPEHARERFEAALAALKQGSESDFWPAVAISNLGLVTARLGDLETGRQLLSEGLSWHRRLGYKFGTALSLRFLGQVCRDAGDLDEAERCFEASLKIDVTRAQQWHVASSLEGLAEVAARRRQAARATRLFGAASQVREEIGVPLEPALIPHYECVTKRVRDALGETAFAEHWARGQRTSVAELIAPNGTNDLDHEVIGLKERETSLLSAREVQILQLVADGKSSREIADTVFISHRTVTTHISNIFAKLDVHDRGAAIAQAYHRGILTSSGAVSVGDSST
ncbi:MAG: tetratricopeptide repeat protein [Thermomicrobiales bacterium]